MIINRVIQEEMSMFLEEIISVIVRKKVHINICLILNGYQIQLSEFTNKKHRKW
jgi:hypothetical protein